MLLTSPKITPIAPNFILTAGFDTDKLTKKPTMNSAKGTFYKAFLKKAKIGMAFSVSLNPIVRSSYSSFSCRAIFRDLSRRCSFSEGSLPT